MLEVLRELLAGGNTDEVMAVVAKLVARNAELERLLVEARRTAKKTEGVSSAQLRLLLDGLPANTDADLGELDKRLKAAAGLDDKPSEEQAAKQKPKRGSGARREIPQSLRRVENVIAVPTEQRPCPSCGAERTCIGHDVTEVIDLIPAEVIVRLDKREKLGCGTCEGELVRAPLGNKVVAGGKMGTTLVAQVLVDKYRDGLPLSRQVERFKRLGVELAISTLADQVAWATEALMPLWRFALAKVLKAMVMHLDATGLPVLDVEAPGGLRLGSIWGYVGSDITDNGAEHTALCIYASTGKRFGQREGELGPAEVLARRTGLTVADASGLFDASFEREDLVECGCNMHARRYFRRALDAGDKRAALPIAAFKKLFAIESTLKAATIEERRVERQSKSKPVYDALLAWAEGYRPHEPPSSALGRALQYLLNHQLALRRFLDDGVIPIDNGIVERLHIRTALTRKNFLFAGSDNGGDRAAVAFTILGCCALSDVDPVKYLADVLPRLAGRKIREKDVGALMPAAWKRAQGDSVGGSLNATAP